GPVGPEVDDLQSVVGQPGPPAAPRGAGCGRGGRRIRYGEPPRRARERVAAVRGPFERAPGDELWVVEQLIAVDHARTRNADRLAQVDHGRDFARAEPRSGDRPEFIG